MCDPVTMALIVGGAAVGAVATAGGGAPAAKLPAIATQEAKAETGAEIILGGEDDEEDEAITDLNAADRRKTSGSGLNVAAKQTGINIL